MDIQQLIKMANQIGSFFETLPDEREALNGIAGHLRKFWTPRMRAQLVAHIDREGNSGLNTMVSTAVRAHRGSLIDEPVR